MYEPGEPDVANCYGVYFPASQDAAGSHTFNPEAERVITVTVARSDKQPVIDEAITVPYVIKESESGIFQMGDIEFASGQVETTLDITFDKAEQGVKYDLTLELENPQYVSTYTVNPTSISLDVLVVTWQYILNPQTGEKALFTITQEAWNETCYGYIKYYEVNDVRTCVLELTGKHVYKGSEYESPYFWGPEGAEVQLEFKMYPKELNKDGYMFVELPPLAYYYHSSYQSMIYFFDYYYYWTVYADSLDNPQGITMSWIEFAKKYEASYPMGYYDNNGGLFFYIVARGMYGIGGWSMGTYDIIGIGEGFVRTDFEIKVMEADYPSDGATPIYVETGRDVAKLRYAIYPGELKESEIEKKVAAISNGTEEGTSVFDQFEYDEDYDVNYATMLVSPEKTGEYTLVAVALDKDDIVQESSASVVFNYIATEDEEDYAVNVSVFTEDTPARYKELHDYDSFAFGISGEDIVEAHVAIFSEAQVNSLGEDAIKEEVKTNGRLALDEDSIAEINADGGFYDVATKLAAKTTFYVVVWATNGSMEKFAVASYTTAALPYVWNKLGTGTLTDGFLRPLFSKPDMTVSCDIYEEANTPGLYKVGGYQAEYIKLWYDYTDDQVTAVKDSRWKETEFIVDATNPTAVFISEQEYGICVNPDYGFMLIDTEKSGTLVDGIITFPVKEMYVGMPGLSQWFYGNANGTFKLVLPSAVAPSASVSVPSVGAKDYGPAIIPASADEYARPKVEYERDAKSVKAAVSVSYDRKEKTGKRSDEAISREMEKIVF